MQTNIEFVFGGLPLDSVLCLSVKQKYNTWVCTFEIHSLLMGMFSRKPVHMHTIAN